MAEEKIILQVDIDSNNTEKSISSLTDEIIELKKAQTNLKNAVKDGSISESEYTKELEKNKASVSKLNAERKNEIKILQSNKNSIESLQASNAKLVKERNKLDLSTTEGIEKYKQLTATIKINQDRLNSYNEAIGRHNGNVGNYKKAVTDAIKESGLFGAEISSIKSAFDATAGGVTKMGISFKSFSGILKASAIGWLLIAFAAIVSYFSKYEAGIRKMEAITAGLATGFQVFIDALAQMGEGIIKFISKPKEAFNSIVEFIKGVYFPILENAAKLLKGVFTLDWEMVKTAVVDLKDHFVSLKDRAVAFADANADAIAQLAKNMYAAGLAAFDYTEQLQKIKDAERALQIERAKSNVQLKEARLLSENPDVSAAKRIAALERVGNAEIALAKKEADLAKQRLDIIKAMNQLSDSKTADLEAERDAEIAYFNLHEQSINKRLELEGKLKSLRVENATKSAKELNDIMSTHLADVEEDAKFELEIKKNLDNQSKQNKIESAQSALDAIAKINDAEYQLYKSNYARKLELQKQANEKQLNAILAFSSKAGDVIAGAAFETEATLGSVIAATAEMLIKELEMYAIAQIIKLSLKQVADGASLNIPGAIAAGVGIAAVKVASAGIRSKIREGANVQNVQPSQTSASYTGVNRQLTAYNPVVNVQPAAVNVSTSAPSANDIGTAVADAVRGLPIVVKVTDINNAQNLKVQVTNNGKF